MGKRITLILVGLFTLFLAACSPSITEGEVAFKDYQEAYTTTHMQCAGGQNGCGVMVPITTHHPEKWSVTIQAKHDGELKVETFTVSESQYNGIEVGDFAAFDKYGNYAGDFPYTEPTFH